MDCLTKEEVMHVSKLAKIKISDEELVKYQHDLKLLIDDIDKIKDIEVISDDMLISPSNNIENLRSDSDTNSISFNDVKENVPKVVGNFVEVPVMINE